MKKEMERKIFNEQGFLTKEGLTFVDDGFSKELKRVVDTASSETDVLIINAILKNMIDNYCSNKRHTFNSKPVEPPKPKEKAKLFLIRDRMKE